MSSLPFATLQQQILPIVSLGWVVPWAVAAARLPVTSTQRVSLLAMRVTNRLPRGESPQFAFGLGLIPLDDDLHAVTLRLQLESHQLDWLAHPEDPALWHLLDEWKDAGHCAFMLMEDEACAATATHFDALDDALRQRYRPNPAFDAGRFVDAVFHLVASDEIPQQATSDISAVRVLTHVEVALLMTDAVLKARPLPVASLGAALPH